MDFAHVDSGTYSLAQVPRRPVWGSEPVSHVLHDPTVGLPIKIWVIGTVVELSADVTSGFLVGRPGPYSATVLRLRLMRAGDSGDMARLMCLGRRKPCTYDVGALNAH